MVLEEILGQDMDDFGRKMDESRSRIIGLFTGKPPSSEKPNLTIIVGSQKIPSIISKADHIQSVASHYVQNGVSYVTSATKKLLNLGIHYAEAEGGAFVSSSLFAIAATIYASHAGFIPSDNALATVFSHAVGFWGFNSLVYYLANKKEYEGNVKKREKDVWCLLASNVAFGLLGMHLQVIEYTKHCPNDFLSQLWAPIVYLNKASLPAAIGRHTVNLVVLGEYYKKENLISLYNTIKERVVDTYFITKDALKSKKCIDKNNSSLPS